MTMNSSDSPSGRRVFWRSLEEKDDPTRILEEARGSDVVKQTIPVSDLARLNRRNFLTLGGAVSTLAGIEGCIRRPVEKIMPYGDAPADVNIGVASHYATATAQRGEAVGLLVQSHEGRPTKIEGNPEHPASLGSSDLYAQAALFDLYDTDRARTPTEGGRGRTYADVQALFKGLTDKQLASGGAGLRVLAEPSISPTFLRLRDRIKQRLPRARFHTYTPLSDGNARAGGRLAFGQPMLALPQLERAKVVVALDCDFMLTEAGSVAATRGYSAGRHMASGADAEPIRLYVVESAMSLTGANADHRLALPSGSIGAYLKALASTLSKQGVAFDALQNAVQGSELAGVPARWLDAVAKDLAAHKGASLVVVGSRQPAAVHALAHAVNAALGNAGRTVTYVAPADGDEADNLEDIAALARDAAAGQVEALIILGGNPVHDAPADVKLAAALAKVPLSVCMSSHLHETAARCTWHVPRAHELETWGDLVSRAGFYSIQQPLIAPMFGGKSDVEILALLAGEPTSAGHDLVRTTATARGVRGELEWQALVQKGVATGNEVELAGDVAIQLPAVAAAVSQIAAPAQAAQGSFELVFLADNKLLDGRYANNIWLLELPDPMTRITWDNAALIAPSTAKALHIANGDMLKISAGGASIDIVAWVQPGQAAGSIGLPLGWGRKAAGRHALGTGFDVYPLRTTAGAGFVSGATIAKAGGTYSLSQTQEHDAMEGRPLAIDATVAEYKERPDFGQWDSPDPSSAPLWKTQDYSEGHQWGMVIDLNRCTGCNACAVACQAENNIPVVGKDQVARGREMAWLRIDRYFVGDDPDQPEVAFQPVGCQHCEQAPCENVCPVNATSHSPEGLNDIAYNRCIGTRYCMNNCPYKVRRFNFHNFNLEIPESQKLMFNPGVTVRFRGVVEKCSYCVQRVQNGKIAAKREGRGLRDGDVKSACQQACPAEAITFGDINDPASAVSKARATDRNYALLAEVGTRPRTRFLGKIRNPNPEMTEKKG